MYRLTSNRRRVDRHHYRQHLRNNFPSCSSRFLQWHRLMSMVPIHSSRKLECRPDIDLGPMFLAGLVGRWVPVIRLIRPVLAGLEAERWGYHSEETEWGPPRLK